MYTVMTTKWNYQMRLHIIADTFTEAEWKFGAPHADSAAICSQIALSGSDTIVFLVSTVLRVHAAPATHQAYISVEIIFIGLC